METGEHEIQGVEVSTCTVPYTIGQLRVHSADWDRWLSRPSRCRPWKVIPW